MPEVTQSDLQDVIVMLHDTIGKPRKEVQTPSAPPFFPLSQNVLLTSI